MNKILISTAVLPKAVNKDFYDFNAIFEAEKLLNVDGFEFVFLPEWDENNQVLTPTSAPNDKKISVSYDYILKKLINSNINIPIVHCNRDIGNYLCMDDKLFVDKGLEILEKNLYIASKIKAKYAVLHLWDTYSESFTIADLFEKINNISQKFDIKILFENIPISNHFYSVNKAWKEIYELISDKYGFTLDLKWCSLYNNYKILKQYIDKVHNVHVQGIVENNTIKPGIGKLNINESLQDFIDLGYKDYITLELNRPKGINDFIKGINYINEMI